MTIPEVVTGSLPSQFAGSGNVQNGRQAPCVERPGAPSCPTLAPRTIKCSVGPNGADPRASSTHRPTATSRGCGASKCTSPSWPAERSAPNCLRTAGAGRCHRPTFPKPVASMRGCKFFFDDPNRCAGPPPTCCPNRTRTSRRGLRLLPPPYLRPPPKQWRRRCRCLARQPPKIVNGVPFVNGYLHSNLHAYFMGCGWSYFFDAGLSMPVGRFGRPHLTWSNPTLPTQWKTRKIC